LDFVSVPLKFSNKAANCDQLLQQETRMVDPVGLRSVWELGSAVESPRASDVVANANAEAVALLPGKLDCSQRDVQIAHKILARGPYG